VTQWSFNSNGDRAEIGTGVLRSCSGCWILGGGGLASFDCGGSKMRESESENI
jgi:hypothetical protein